MPVAPVGDVGDKQHPSYATYFASTATLSVVWASCMTNTAIDVLTFSRLQLQLPVHMIHELSDPFHAFVCSCHLTPAPLLSSTCISMYLLPLR